MTIESIQDVYEWLKKENVNFKFDSDNLTERYIPIKRALSKMCKECSITKGMVHYLSPMATAMGAKDWNNKALKNFYAGYNEWSTSHEVVDNSKHDRQATALKAATGEIVPYSNPEFRDITFNNKGYVEDIILPRLKKSGIEFNYNADEDSRRAGEHRINMIARDAAQTEKINQFLENLGYHEGNKYMIKTGLVKPGETQDFEGNIYEPGNIGRDTVLPVKVSKIKKDGTETEHTVPFKRQQAYRRDN